VLSQLVNLAPPSTAAWETVIVDNHSTDSTEIMARQFLRSHLHLNIRYVFEPALGLSNARNRGIAEARGELLAFTDDDVVLGEDWLLAMEGMLSQKDYLGFGGKIIPTFPPNLPDWLVVKGPFALTTGGVVVSHDHGNEIKEYTGRMQRPIGANIFFRREAFEKFGLFRTDLGKKGKEVFFGEDSEFSSRLERGGARLLYFPQAVVYHPVDPARLRKGIFREYFFQMGRYRGYRNDYPPHIVRYLGIPRHLFRRLLVKLREALFALGTFKWGRVFYYELMIRALVGEIVECYRSGMSDARDRGRN
jgi:glycosyltransferase involved in cell wall biosynthesis